MYMDFWSKIVCGKLTLVTRLKENGRNLKKVGRGLEHLKDFSLFLTWATTKNKRKSGQIFPSPKWLQRMVYIKGRVGHKRHGPPYLLLAMPYFPSNGIKSKNKIDFRGTKVTDLGMENPYLVEQNHTFNTLFWKENNFNVLTTRVWPAIT